MRYAPRSQRQEARLRAPYAAALAAGVVLECWKCRRTLRQGDAWVLGHIVPVHLGGELTEANTDIECRACSDSEGGTTGRARQREARGQGERRWI